MICRACIPDKVRRHSVVQAASSVLWTQSLVDGSSKLEVYRKDEGCMNHRKVSLSMQFIDFHASDTFTALRVEVAPARLLV